MGKRYDALNYSNSTNTLQPCLSRFDGISSDPNEQGYGYTSTCHTLDYYQ